MDPSDAEPQPRPVQDPRRKKNLTNDERMQVVSTMLRELQNHGNDGKLARGTITAVALEFHVCTKTIRNIWRVPSRILKIRKFGALCKSQKLGRSGRRKKWNHDDICEAVKLVPNFQRRTIRDLAVAIGIPKSTLHAMKLQSRQEMSSKTKGICHNTAK